MMSNVWQNTQNVNNVKRVLKQTHDDCDKHNTKHDGS